MNAEEKWNAIDAYIERMVVGEDEILRAAVEASAAAGLPPIQVSVSQGKFLHLLARIQNTRKALEIGTLGGYSSIWLARALPEGGKLITLELSAKHAEVARANINRAKLTGRVDLRVGPAIDILPRLEAEGCGPFDFIFIDADKPGTPQYFEWALKLSRRGSVIVVDNVIRHGALLDENRTDPAVQGMLRFTRMLAAESRVSGTVIQTVGSKGHDGFAVLVVN